MSPRTLSRRRVLELTGTTAAAVALAGCTDGSAGTSDDRDDESTGGDDTDADGAEFGDWFDDVSNYDGVVDATGEDEVTVDVGAGSDGYSFAPAAIRVSVGTAVVWEWTGDGGGHNVAEEDGAFESDIVTDAGHTFEHTFDSPGRYRYVCEPHVSMGMKGAVVVE